MAEAVIMEMAMKFGIPAAAFFLILLYLLKTIQNEKQQHVEAQKEMHSDAKEREEWMRQQVERLSDIQEDVSATLRDMSTTLNHMGSRLDRLENKIS